MAIKKINLVMLVLLLQFAAQAENIKALVGGVLIDGFKDQPIQNSVIIIRNDKISAVGEMGQVEIPEGVEANLVEGMTVLLGL